MSKKLKEYSTKDITKVVVLVEFNSGIHQVLIDQKHKDLLNTISPLLG